jgi:hypothetical protein
MMAVFESQDGKSRLENGRRAKRDKSAEPSSNLAQGRSVGWCPRHDLARTL